jgi:hypothetical protein
LRMTFNELAQTAKKPRLVARAVMANYLLFPGVTIALLMLFRASNVSSDWIPRSRSPPPPPDRVRARPVLHLEEPAAKSSNFVACSTGWRRAARAPPQLSSASSPSVIAHARNDRAAIRALASSDTSCRRRTRRSRLCGNRGPTNVRANSVAASSSVRTVTSRARRRGGSNTKFVTHRKLASHNRSSGGARSCRKLRASASITGAAG